MTFYLGLSSAIKVAASTPGARLTSLEKRLAVWQCYHDNSSQSTNTSRPARLRVDEKKLLHQDLPFVDTCRIVSIRCRDYYENHWFILNTVLRVLYAKYLSENMDKAVSLGIFHSLRPFYLRTPTIKYIEMCCCKTHLHAKWAIEAVIANVKKQRDLELKRRRKRREENMKKGIVEPEVVDDFSPIPFDDYRSFYALLTNECGTDETTYISGECTQNKKHFCKHVKLKWLEMKTMLLDEDDKVTTVPLQHFEKTETTNKHDVVVKRLRQITTQASIEFLITFVETMIPQVIHQRNHLKHYCQTIHPFQDHFRGIFIDIDFSQNLDVPVKFEPQSLHWTHEQVTVHSGIMKTSENDIKQYHPYISDDLKHDQQFVEVVLDKMLDGIEVQPNIHIIIESDNCSSQ